MTLKQLGSVFALSLCFLAVAIFPACKSAKLDPGGAYAPVTGDGTPAAAPDLVFYQVDAAFDLAHSTLDLAFRFERENRTYLWQLSPDVKRTLDKIRPQAVKAVADYTTARAAYAANPSPPGLDTLQSILAKAQQVASAANAVLPPKLQAKGKL